MRPRKRRGYGFVGSGQGSSGSRPSRHTTEAGDEVWIVHDGTGKPYNWLPFGWHASPAEVLQQLERSYTLIRFVIGEDYQPETHA